MLAIARGIMSDPEVLIIDELSLGLAPLVVQQLTGTLKALKDSGMTILLVEQNVHLALALSDYAYVIAEGRPFTEGSCAEVAQKPRFASLSGALSRKWLTSPDAAILFRIDLDQCRSIASSNNLVWFQRNVSDFKGG